MVLTNLGEPRAATETLTPSVPAEANEDTFFVLDEVHTQLPRALNPSMLSKIVDAPVQVLYSLHEH